MSDITEIRPLADAELDEVNGGNIVVAGAAVYGIDVDGMPGGQITGVRNLSSGIVSKPWGGQ